MYGPEVIKNIFRPWRQTTWWGITAGWTNLALLVLVVAVLIDRDISPFLLLYLACCAMPMTLLAVFLDFRDAQRTTADIGERLTRVQLLNQLAAGERAWADLTIAQQDDVKVEYTRYLLARKGQP